MTGKLKRDNVIHWTIIIGISNFYNVFLGTFSIMFGRHSGTYAQGVAMGKTECVINKFLPSHKNIEQFIIHLFSFVNDIKSRSSLTVMYVNKFTSFIKRLIFNNRFSYFLFCFSTGRNQRKQSKPQKNYNTENDSRSAGLFAGSWRHTSTL
jgi:hypothetical protein